jgi:hypothetical protein
MRRLFLASIAVVSAVAVVPYAVKAQPTPKKGALPQSNQVYVKIILPTDPATRDADRPVVESWIAEELKKRGQSKVTAATAWVPLAVKGEAPTSVWNGGLDGKAWGCPVTGRIMERTDGRIKVRLDGWIPVPYGVTVSLNDEPGSREIAAVERIKTDQRRPYVAVLVGPPSEQPAAPKKGALPKSNQVYVKIILPNGPAARDRLVVESWIAEQLKNRGQTKFTAATAWVPIVAKAEESEVPTRVYGYLEKEPWGCPVSGQITERAGGRIKVLLRGWSPGGAEVTISLTDEPGSRAIAAVEEVKTEEGLPYLAVVIGPPAEKPAAPKKGALPKSNPVYVKIILPTDPAARDADRPGVESWIVEELKKRGQSKFTAATAWVPLAGKRNEATSVWDGTFDKKQCNCPVAGDIPERADGRIKVLLDGWAPFYVKVTVSLTNEPGSRALAAVEQPESEERVPYVAVLIGPPLEKPAARTDPKK